MTCPFLERVEAGDYLGAVGVAMRAPNPVEAVVAVQLLGWGRELVDTGAVNLADAGLEARMTRAELARTLHGPTP